MKMIKWAIFLLIILSQITLQTEVLESKRMKQQNDIQRIYSFQDLFQYLNKFAVDIENKVQQKFLSYFQTKNLIQNLLQPQQRQYFDEEYQIGKQKQKNDRNIQQFPQPQNDDQNSRNKEKKKNYKKKSYKPQLNQKLYLENNPYVKQDTDLKTQQLKFNKTINVQNQKNNEKLIQSEQYQQIQENINVNDNHNNQQNEKFNEKRRELLILYLEKDGETADYDKQYKERLEQSCQNGSKLVMTQGKYFQCNQVWVSYEEFIKAVLKANNEQNTEIVYDNNNVLWPDENPDVDYDNMEYFYQDYDYSLADCLVYNSWEEACLCSIDYQGILCEENNQVLCDYEYQYSGGQDGQQCDYDKYRYNPDIGGDPPCNLVEGGEKFHLNFKLQCRNEEQNKIEKLELKNADFWTIHWDKKVLQDSKLVLPDSSRYSYELYEEYTVLNANGEDGEYILVRVVKPDYNVKKTAINWQILSKSFVFENQSQGLSIDQLIGKDNLQLEIDLSSIPEEYIYQGRYSLEVDIKSEKNNETEYSIINQIRLFLDSQSYKIPKADNGFNFWIILIIIIAFLVVLSIFLYIVYKKYQIKGQRLLKIHNMRNAKKQQQYQEQGGTFSEQE